MLCLGLRSQKSKQLKVYKSYDDELEDKIDILNKRVNQVVEKVADHMGGMRELRAQVYLYSKDRSKRGFTKVFRFFLWEFDL